MAYVTSDSWVELILLKQRLASHLINSNYVYFAGPLNYLTFGYRKKVLKKKHLTKLFIETVLGWRF